MNIDTRIKFRHLQCFLAVAHRGSLARASETLAISQPAVSKTLKELEQLLGVALFERSKSGAALTSAGFTFLRYAGPSVQALREGVQSLRSGELEGGLVRLGVLSTVESSLLPDVVRALHSEHPTLVVSVVTGPSSYLLSQLRMGDLDLVVGRMTDSPQIEGLAFEHLYSEAMVLVVRPQHPLLNGSADARTALCEYPAVLPLTGTTIRRHADSLYVQLGVGAPRQRLETLSVALSRRYVLTSNAVWIAPQDAVRHDLERGDLEVLDPGLQEPGGSVGICSNPTVPMPLTAQWCCEALRAASQTYRDTLHQ
ncbi:MULTISPECIES: pca operon transcription factor PcaQ [unclassified Pseudomonas]|uniref:pca operon transcription factor PcaQ n=1 Tax=unclassified Pseudomonas TaxID=196821 RepID=UPI000C87E05D|nr:MULTISPECIES: pca operon transcription factor PcaQ [unclassified Pseudomonas]PMX27642.1 pca operon transcription factor PcaQ [Pseudomonas sp. GW460-12]PMX35585.1 pca operon transcription factor PcaQ [Pseudomonas sp. MPR-R2A4]PMX42234.1 pca operon transcription factor PcaQ [Pseudomonas sp. MPR-R2A7]PMX53720.1 pca operon transcription factor PcaQ [Pseudomonas sp. MPR-R2A6]PMX90640.1 pca operon transcription factor PcaQ [Pseudomonas sp. MPR-R2A3]